MLDQISRKKHTGLYTFFFDLLYQLISVHAFPAGDQESKPARLGILTCFRKDQFVFGSFQCFFQIIEIMNSAFYKGRELAQLGTSHSRLHIRCFQVISEMRIYIFMIISQRQFPVLAVKTMTTQIILSGCAHAVSSPVTERTHDLMKQRILCIDGSALSHCHMMWRIKTGGSDIPDGSGQSALSVDRITGTQRIAVILDQPQIVTVTEIFYRFQIKRVAQGMCKHHCFCFF